MELSVLLFASLKEAAGSERIAVQVAPQASVAQFLESLAAQHPELASWLPHVHVAVNCEYAAREDVLKPSDEIALLTPVSGGTP